MTSSLSDLASDPAAAAPGPGQNAAPRLANPGGALRSLIAPAVICLLLAIGQMAIAGYELGVGNQSIQVAFLERAANPAFYADDLMVNDTVGAYPTYFFKLLAPFLYYVDIHSLYLWLQIATAFAALCTVYALSQSIFKSRLAALAAVGVLVPGHLQALAGEVLYSPAFTHTFVALPIALAALVMGFRGRWYWAFGIAAALFNIHALTASFALLMLSAGLLADISVISRRDWISRTVLCGALVFALASPTLAIMFRQHQQYDAQWISLMHVRSGDHSFASTWWSESDPDIARFALLLALFALSWSFSPGQLPQSVGEPNASRPPAQRVVLLMFGAVLAFFAIGYLLTDVWPTPVMIRMQPFRASRLLLVLMVVYIAHGAVCGIRAGVRGRYADAGSGATALALPIWLRVLEIACGLLVIATLLVPALEGLLPVTVLVTVLVGVVAGRISWRQSAIAAAGLLVAVLAWRQIDFPLLPAGFSRAGARGAASVQSASAADLRLLGSAAILAAISLAAAVRFIRHRPTRRIFAGLMAVLSLVLTGGVYGLFRGEKFSGGNFADVADWADAHTPVRTLFLAPADVGNFRVASRRSLVTDWRDGTQLYFASEFAREWFTRIEALKPGLSLSSDGSRLISPGEGLGSLSDTAILDMANKYQVDYILLPNPAPDRPRNFPVAFAGQHYTVYEPRIETGDVPAGVLDAGLWKDGETFMATTVKDNIEKYRKTDVTVQVVDKNGEPVQSVPMKLDQTKQAFIFGASLGFFESNGINVPGDEKAPLVKPAELEKMPEVFNGSVIAFSSKWAFTEDVRGQEHWSDLDKYVDYCTSHGIEMEYHHLTGTLPGWVRALDYNREGPQEGLSFSPVKPELQTEFTRHALDTVARYADRIKYFQVMNEKYLMEYTPPVFKLLKEKYPKNKFGISDCVKFWDGEYAPGTTDGNLDIGEFQGVDALDWLEKQGIRPDFFSIHGHRPWGLWADPTEMYRILDYFKERGTRVHISEEYVDIGTPVVGPIRNGIVWDPALQADYLSRFLTVAFSHPDVDMVNLWGLSPGWGFDGSSKGGSGILDASGNPRPAWDALKKLFTETWRSHVSGVTGLDGGMSSRVFQGSYSVAVSLASGKIVTGTLEVPSEKAAATYRFVLDADKGTLEAVEK